ncbi:DUF3180 domain-containing protein [Tessaracoccus oleiagri]|uniref:DUF3180 domain-containing protein n=1 Tax=Tessaracoccus oleiagri TaxID=686624 RepID=A0A1G9MXI2_9ACTN|nr:DUF3180 domain-containing protein [Tessaracoccus oleiagri]SDL78823.1 Protein of unknown function [Tessaracoccus oleiagri]
MRNKLSLTSPRQTVIAVLAGALVSWLLLSLYDALAEYPPVVPWTVPIVLGALGVGGIIYAALLPKRREERRLGSQEAFIALVTAKSLIVTGAVLAGAHAVYVMKYLPAMSASTPLQRVVQGSGTIIAALVMALAGSLIERQLVIKDPPDDTQDERHAEGSPS